MGFCSDVLGQNVDLFVVPEEYTKKEGPGDGMLYPFDPAAFGNITGLRLQQLYEGALFPEYQNGAIIESIAFRLSGSATEGNRSFDVTFPDVEVRISTTSKSVGGMREQFASNTGADEVIVFKSPLRWQATFTPGQVQAMSVIIPFSVPFVYQPAKGSLLIDISVREMRQHTGQVDLAIDQHLEVVRGIIPNQRGETFPGAGLITRFGITAVPEPTTTLLMIVSVATVGITLRLQRRLRK